MIRSFIRRNEIMRKIFLAALLTPMLMFVFISAVQAQSPQETLNQYISALQKNPADYALREKIIKHVQTMSPAPAIPEEARRYLVRGRAAFKGAREVKDFNEAAEEFKKALLAAPWLTEGYYNLGIVQDKAGLYADAMQSLKLYLMAAPNAPDTEKVKELIYEIEYRQEKAAREASPQAIAEKKRQTEEEFIKKLNGVRYVSSWSSRAAVGYSTLDIRGNKIVQGWTITRCIEPPCAIQTGVWEQTDEAILNGRKFNFSGNCMSGGKMVKRVFNGKISEDGSTVTIETCAEPLIYRRER
jgi:tetratricopeptide (TPR) repeat protein